MDKEIKTDFSQLYHVLELLQGADEYRSFFEDIATIKELEDMAQRLNVAVLLDKGYSYNQICDMTGVSTATISRVNRCLRYGEGYRLALKHLNEE